MVPIQLNPSCPKCQKHVEGVFPPVCPHCGFNIDAVAGRGTTDFQARKWAEHSDLLYGRAIRLDRKEFNASFDYYGQANIDDLVRFTITYGEHTTTPSNRGNIDTKLIVAYIPQIVGSGVTRYSQHTIPCSGICLISPASKEYAHSYPVLDDWMTKKFQGLQSTCRLCGAPTGFAEPICRSCYSSINGDWKKLL